MTTRSFHVGDLLSVTDGRLVSPRHIGGVYDVVNFVTGQPHMTHQLNRACAAVKPWLIRQHPWLAEVSFDYEIPKSASNDDTMTIIMGWLGRVATRYGEHHYVEPMPDGTYVGREPTAELREMAPHAQIIGVAVPPTGEGGAQT